MKKNLESVFWQKVLNEFLETIIFKKTGAQWNF
jgi:hypothetical protein